MRETVDFRDIAWHHLCIRKMVSQRSNGVWVNVIGEYDSRSGPFGSEIHPAAT